MSTPPPAPEPYDATSRSGAAQPQYAPPPTGYAAEPTGRPKGPKGLGLIAFIVALAGAVIGSVLAAIAGAQTGALAQYVDVTTGSQVDPNSLPPEAEQAAITGSLLAVAAFAVWGVLALWGLIQGIIAAVKNRGRGWGIAAIVIAVLGVGAVAIFLGIGVAIGAAPYVQSGM